VVAALEADAEGLRVRAEELAERLADKGFDAHAEACAAAVGGGGAPGVELPSWAVSLPETFAAALRVGEPPVVGHVVRGRCLLDLRTVEPGDDTRLYSAVLACTS
jgi:L-seryl-tRNA(Ser) seleniumtransferase